MDKRRKRIGVFIGDANSYHTQNVLQGIYDGAKDFDMDVVVFPGNQIDYCFLDGDEAEHDYVYYIEMMHDYVNTMCIDAMIISFESHTALMDAESKAKLLEYYTDIPYVLLEESCNKDKSGYIVSDNYRGMKSVVEHLVDFHGYRRLVYLSGSIDNVESIERQRAFEDVLEEHDIKVNDTMIAHGDFTAACREQIEYLLDNNSEIEVFVCANDIMAYATYSVFEERGIKVGNPRINEGAIAVTGYDDNAFSANLDPSLTTVQQDFYASGYTAIGYVLSLLRDGRCENGIMPTYLMKRSSCGCEADLLQRFMPINDTEKTNPEFYAIKIAEIISEEILLNGVGDEAGDAVYSMICEALSIDIKIWHGIINDTVSPALVVNQLRELLKEHGRYISVTALFDAFSEYLSCLIHSSNEQLETVLLSNILSEGTRYLQSYIYNQSEAVWNVNSLRVWQTTLMQRKMLLNSDSRKKIFNVALDKIMRVEKAEVYIFLYDEPRVYTPGEGWKAIDKIYLAAYANESEGKVIFDDCDRNYVEKVLERMKNPNDKKWGSYTLSSINFGDNNYGFIVNYGLNTDVLFLSMCGIQIGMALSNAKSVQ